MRKKQWTIFAAALVLSTIIMVPIAGNAQLLPTLQDVIDAIGGARDRAIEARDAAQETRDAVREGRERITTQVRETISDAVDDVTQIIEDERAGRDAFLPGGVCGTQCISFRNDLLTLVENMETTANGIVGITSLSVDLEFQNTKDLINNLPGRALFPLYRLVVAENNILNSLSTVMGTVGDNLSILDVDQCDAILSNPETFSAATKSVNAAAISFKIVGKFLDARGETSLTEGDVGIHGYVHITVKTNQVKKVGSLLTGVSDSLRAAASFASGKQRFCTILASNDNVLMGQQVIIDRQELILQNQSDILAAIENITPPGLRR